LDATIVDREDGGSERKVRLDEILELSRATGAEGATVLGIAVSGAGVEGTAVFGIVVSGAGVEGAAAWGRAAAGAGSVAVVSGFGS